MTSIFLKIFSNFDCFVISTSNLFPVWYRAYFLIITCHSFLHHKVTDTKVTFSSVTSQNLCSVFSFCYRNLFFVIFLILLFIRFPEPPNLCMQHPSEEDLRDLSSTGHVYNIRTPIQPLCPPGTEGGVGQKCLQKCKLDDPLYESKEQFLYKVSNAFVF